MEKKERLIEVRTAEGRPILSLHLTEREVAAGERQAASASQASSQSNNDSSMTDAQKRYLFRILAFKTIFSNPENYGFDIPDEHLYPPLEYITVIVDTTVNSFAEFAAVYGTNYKILKAFNPWLRQPYLNNKSGESYEIKIPVDGARTKAYE